MDADWFASFFSAGRGPVVFLTGAGVSAESGIPTFRGAEGYWRVGSRNHHPMELATNEAFTAMPEEVWGWYLYRRATCRAAVPNEAHRAIAALERRLGDRFLLVTQNVDGLHLRAGNTLERTYQIHGNIDFCRCVHGCKPATRPLPIALGEEWARGRTPGPDERALLSCDTCGAWLRPHVLWFDECYDEPLFRFDSTLRAARTCAALVVVGTSGATNLPAQMCELVAARGVPFLVIGLEETPFSALAQRSPHGRFLQGTACALVPELCERALLRYCRE